MAWTKIPPENLPLFRAALPEDRRIQTMQMFGGLAAKVNGNFFGGAFARSVMLMLSPTDREEALALDGAAPFDPMGNGAMRSDKVQMPESIMDEPEELRRWVKRSFEYAASLPEKVKAKPGASMAKAVAKAKPAPKAAKRAAGPKAKAKASVRKAKPAKARAKR